MKTETMDPLEKKLLNMIQSSTDPAEAMKIAFEVILKALKDLSAQNGGRTA